MLPVAFIIPSLNEADSIGAVLDSLADESRRLNLRVSRAIVVDNGSSDATAAAAAAHGAEVIHEPRRGYGRACLAGIAALPSEAQIVVFLDADGSDDAADLGALLGPIFADDADFVLGSRTLGAREPGALTLMQRFGNCFASRLIHVLFDARYTDLGPFRAIRRQSLSALRMQDTDFGWTIEMQIKAHQRGLRIREVPVRYRRRAAGESKVSGSLHASARAGVKILWTGFKLRFRGSEPEKKLNESDRSRTA